MIGNRKIWPIRRRNQPIETSSKVTEMMEIADKTLKQLLYIYTQEFKGKHTHNEENNGRYKSHERIRSIVK